MIVSTHNTMVSNHLSISTTHPPCPALPPQAQPVEKIENPTHTDVLLGRGVATNRHPGNENFRDIVSKHVDVYVTSTKKQKMMISRSIVDMVRRDLDPPGRFLEKDPETGLWSEVGDKKALEKTAQALRDGAAPLRKQLSEDMSDPTFLAAVFDDHSKLAPTPEPEKEKGHRRINTAPVGCPTIPQIIPVPDPKRSKPNSPVYTPMDNNFLQSIAANNMMVDTTNSPHATTPQFQVSLSPNSSTQSPLPSGNRKSPISPRSSKNPMKRGQHRRLHTFGGYSCSDHTSVQDFLSKEALLEGIPPLFASQIPNQPMEVETPESQMLLTQTQHVNSSQPQTLYSQNPTNYTPTAPPFYSSPFPAPSPYAVPNTTALHAPSAAPAATTSPASFVAPSKQNRHRRHHTMGGPALQKAGPVFNDDPNLFFDFGSIANQEQRNNNNTYTSDDQPPQDFSLLNLEIPELPLTGPPVTKTGRGHHRRMHTTGHCSLGGGDAKNRTFNFGDLSPMALAPLHEEKQWHDPNALDKLMDSIEPLDHRPRSNGASEESSSLTNEDFLKLANDVDYDIGLPVLNENSTLSMDENDAGLHHLIGDCEPTPFAPGRNGSFYVKREDPADTTTSGDSEFDAAMGSDEVFLNLASPERLELADDCF